MKDKNYEAMYDGYIGETFFRKDLIDLINNTSFNNLREISSQLNYGLSNYDLIRIAKEYKKYNKEFNAKVNYLLTDMNFHSELETLINNPDELISSCKQEIEKVIERDIPKLFKDNYIDNGDNGWFSNIALDKHLISKPELDFLESKGILEPYSNGYQLTDKYLQDYFSKKSKDEMEL